MLRTGNPQHEQAYLYSAQNPLLFSDPLGLFGPGALATAGGACVAGDGPLPIGDLVGVPLLIGATVWAAGIVVTDWWNNADSCSDCELDESDESDKAIAVEANESDERDCKEIKEFCILKCVDEELPTGTPNGDPFFFCFRNCMTSFGC
jgi:hypothetical protein